MRDIEDFFIEPTAIQKEFFNAHRGKHFIISRIFLYLHLCLPDERKNLAKPNFYDFFRKKILGTPEEFSHKRHIIIDHSYFLPGMPQEFEDIINKSISLMESNEYNPPKEINDIINHLASLWFYFVYNYNYPPSLLDMKLYHSFVRIIGEAYLYYGSLLERNMRDSVQRRESFRLKRASIEQTAKREERKTFTYELFYRSRLLKKGVKLHTAAKIIRNEFLNNQNSGVIPKDVKPPSIDTIRTYLRENDDIQKCFTEK